MPLIDLVVFKGVHLDVGNARHQLVHLVLIVRIQFETFVVERFASPKEIHHP